MPDINELLAGTERQLEEQVGRLDEAIAAREDELAVLRRQRQRAESALRSLRGEDIPTPGRAGRGANRRAILDALREHPGMTARELAEQTAISRPTVTAALKRLSDEGIVRKARTSRGVEHELA
jgi:DNA-binding transcriptional ArsR family regulator